MTAADAPSDAASRERIRTDFGATLFVEAAAGTGKTSELVKRIVGMVRTGHTALDRVVALTFTDKAAGEMRLRLRAALESSRGIAEVTLEEAGRLERALEHLEVARLGTIHSFCADLLRERPVEAGIDPLFEIAPTEEEERLVEETFEEWFEKVLEDPPEGVRRILRQRSALTFGDSRSSPRELLRDGVRALVRQRDFLAPWRREAFERERSIDEVMVELEAVARLTEHASDPTDWLTKNLKNLSKFTEAQALQEKVRGRDYDALEAGLRDLLRRRRPSKTGWEWKGWGSQWGLGLPRAEVVGQRDALHRRLQNFVDAADADLAACLHAELRPVVAAYQLRKRREGKLDFSDLLVCARDLIRDNSAVRAGLQRRFSHYLVDEFQDTDPVQVELLLLLAADEPCEQDFRRARPIGGKLFLVGDPKQSIYRFRGADIRLYESTKARLASAGGQGLQLTRSFRSVPALQSAVNGAFASSMRPSPDGSQAVYVPLSPSRTDATARPALIALPVPHPYGEYGKITAYAVNKSVPDLVAAFVHWLVGQSGWTIRERDDSSAEVPIQPRHICVLFRRFQGWEDVTRPYVRALEARQIPHVLLGGRSVHEREEMLAIRNALHAIEWPDDTLRVYATLRGPFFALTDDAILVFREATGSLHPLRRLDAAAIASLSAEASPVAEALQILGDLHVRRQRRPIAETLSAFLRAVRAHAGLAVWPTGEQALANCLRVLSRAQRFERAGSPSFRAFVDVLEREAEKGEGEEAPVVEEGTEGVRVLTVHRAKGLEFPVVVLADPMCKAIRDVPGQHVDPERGLWAAPLGGMVPRELLEAVEIEKRREAEEAVRVSYVASTRARDILVAPVVGDGPPLDGWFSSINDALYPSPESSQEPDLAPGCPPFGVESVLERPSGTSAVSVVPGMHRARAGNEVVWWDPATLTLGVETPVGLRQEIILHADEGGETSSEGTRKHEAWKSMIETARAHGARFSLQVITATGLAALHVAAPADEVIDVYDLRVATETGHARGTRLGSLVHAALAAVDLDAAAEAVQGVVQMNGRLLGASREEIQAAGEIVSRALACPLLRRAAHAKESLRRETPLHHLLPSGALVEGVVDLAFRDTYAGTLGWTVVDFKTGRAGTRPYAADEEQVRLYARAISAATSEPARGVLLLL